MGTPEVGLTAGVDTSLFQDIAGAEVVAVSRKRGHHFSKEPQLSIHLLAGLGVEGDGHLGHTVQHVYDKRKNPGRLNLRQVHLLPAELFHELKQKGFKLQPGDLGENITTRNLDLLHLPWGTRLQLGGSAIVEVTGLRDPCVQMDRFLPGLMAVAVDRDEQGKLVSKAGIMGIVLESGMVQAGDAIRVELPSLPYRVLEAV